MKIRSDDSTPPRKALASTKADLRELKGNTSATVSELREFLRELKGKSPQEMLGVVTASSLFHSILLSSAIVLGGILIFTAIPYFLTRGDEPAPIAEKPNTPEPPPAATPEEQAPEPDPSPDPITTLGVGEEWAAPAGGNPLENKNDDFLKDLE